MKDIILTFRGTKYLFKNKNTSFGMEVVLYQPYWPCWVEAALIGGLEVQGSVRDEGS